MTLLTSSPLSPGPLCSVYPSPSSLQLGWAPDKYVPTASCAYYLAGIKMNATQRAHSVQTNRPGSWREPNMIQNTAEPTGITEGSMARCQDKDCSRRSKCQSLNRKVDVCGPEGREDQAKVAAQEGPPFGLAGQSCAHSKCRPACGLEIENPPQHSEEKSNEECIDPLQSVG